MASTYLELIPKESRFEMRSLLMPTHLSNIALRLRMGTDQHMQIRERKADVDAKNTHEEKRESTVSWTKRVFTEQHVSGGGGAHTAMMQQQQQNATE